MISIGWLVHWFNWSIHQMDELAGRKYGGTKIHFGTARCVYGEIYLLGLRN